MEPRHLVICGLVGPMGSGKTRTAIEACTAAADAYENTSGSRPLVLYTRLDPDHWLAREDENVLDILGQALVFAKKNVRVNEFPNLKFGTVASALKRDGFTKVLLHLDEVQSSRHTTTAILRGCLQTMKYAGNSVVVIPIFSGISFPNRKTLPSDPTCVQMRLQPFANDELLEPFCSRIGVPKEVVVSSVNFRLLFDLCAGSPHIVNIMTNVILNLSTDKLGFARELKSKLSVDSARKVYKQTVEILKAVYGAVRWHDIVRGDKFEDVGKRSSWPIITKTVLEWIFCQGFLGEKIPDISQRVGTVDQNNDSFPTYSQCIEAGLFAVGSTKTIEIPLLGLMVVNELVNILPTDIKDPFISNWSTFELIGAVSIYIRLKLAQLKGEKFIKVSCLRPIQTQHLEEKDLLVEVPDDDSLRLVTLGAWFTGKKGDTVVKAEDGLGDNEVEFTAGLVAITNDNQKALDAIILLKILHRNQVLMILNQTKSRVKNVGNGKESSTTLTPRMVLYLFKQMQETGRKVTKQFKFSDNVVVMFDVFSDKLDPKSIETEVKGKSYFVTRNSNLSESVGPTLALFANKRMRLSDPASGDQ